MFAAYELGLLVVYEREGASARREVAITGPVASGETAKG